MPCLLEPLFPLSQGQDAVGASEEGTPAAQGVQRADLDQAFQGASIEGVKVSPAAKVLQGDKLPLPLPPGGDDGFHCAKTHVFYRCQPEANAIFAICLLNSEGGNALVDVREQNGNVKPMTLSDGGGYFLRLPHVHGEHRGHVLRRVVCLEISGLIGDHGIAYAMGLVEGIAGKGLDEVKNLPRHLGGEPPLLCPGDEVLPLLPHGRGDLLAHCLAEDISLPQAIASEGLNDEQHLVLVDDNPVGFLQDLRKGGVGELYRLQAVLGLDKGRDMLHRTGTVKGDHGRHIGKGGGLEFLDEAAHPRPLELENARGLP
ncbi:hypothetical protein ES703_03826 [subsurface metagenome]